MTTKATCRRMTTTRELGVSRPFPTVLYSFSFVYPIYVYIKSFKLSLLFDDVIQLFSVTHYREMITIIFL
jgi:hypothetical protein